MAYSSTENGRMFTQLRKNNWEGVVVCGLCNAEKDRFCTVSMRATVQLNAGDLIYVDMKTENTELYDDGGHYTQFTGWLVDEDLPSLPTRL